MEISFNRVYSNSQITLRFIYLLPRRDTQVITELWLMSLRILSLIVNTHPCNQPCHLVFDLLSQLGEGGLNSSLGFCQVRKLVQKFCHVIPVINPETGEMTIGWLCGFIGSLPFLGSFQLFDNQKNHIMSNAVNNQLQIYNVQ